MRVWQRLQRFGSVLQLHQVILLRIEIDQDLVEKEIPAVDLAETPTLVKAKFFRFELIETGCGLGADLPRVNHCL